jgi:hypothetical protein
MTLIYIINTYDEHGPEDIRATADPEVMLRIFDTLVAADLKRAQEAKWLPRYLDETTMALSGARKKMGELLAAGEVGSHNLLSGWGGYQLHIAESET